MNESTQHVIDVGQVLTREEWRELVQQETVAVMALGKSEKQRRLDLVQEYRDSLIEFGLEPTLATMAASEDGDLAELEKYVAYVRYLPSGGPALIQDLVADMRAAAVDSGETGR